MKTARSKQTLVVVAAALVLSGVFGAFFHQHAPILLDPTASCPLADSEVPFGHCHLLPADDAGSDGCTICFFNRCASHGAPFVAHAQTVEFDSTSVDSSSGVIPVSLPPRLNQVRGPPAV